MKATRQFQATPAMLAVILLVAACSSSNNNPTAPVEEPEVPRVTETFTGTFGLGELSENTFTVMQTGPVEMTITSLEPVQTLTVGLGIGNFDPAADPECAIIATDSRVVVGATLLSSGIDPGEYCVQVRDVGNVFPDAIVTYRVRVIHP